MPGGLGDAMARIRPEQCRAGLVRREAETTPSREKLGLPHPASWSSAPHDANAGGPSCPRNGLTALKIPGCGRPG